MNLIFQLLILILITFIIFWIIAGAEVFSEINANNDKQSNNKTKSLCNKLTMKDCLNNPYCKYITSSKDFRVNSCVDSNNDSKDVRVYNNDDYTRALIANDNLYRNVNVSVFD
mgnify:CR=1 FL=1